MIRLSKVVTCSSRFQPTQLTSKAVPFLAFCLPQHEGLVRRVSYAFSKKPEKQQKKSGAPLPQPKDKSDYLSGS